MALNPGLSTVYTLDLATADTTTSLSVSAEPVAGAPVTYTASVAPPAGRAEPLTPGGSVRFTDDGHVISGCAAVTVSALQASCRTTYAAAGVHRISAGYGGDANFAASQSPERAVRVGFPSVIGAITATMSWTFHYTPRYTAVQELHLSGAARGSTIVITCRGTGCPFQTSSRTVRAAGAIDLDGRLRGHHLAPGDTLQIAIRRLRYIGKYYRFRVRAGRPPAVLISCLAQGSGVPGAGCTAP